MLNRSPELLITAGLIPRSLLCNGHGSVKVALSRIKNPSKSPFTKGDFQIPPLEKGEGGFLDKRNQFIESKN